MRWPLLLLVLSACTSPKSILTPSEVLETSGYPRTDPFMERKLKDLPESLGKLLNRPEYRISIIYTRIDRDKNGKPSFEHHFYKVDPAVYFYPASTVKMPVAFLALQKLNELNVSGLNRESTMITGKSTEKQTIVYNDPESADGRPTIANYIRKIFLVSDNDAYNRLYEFLGQEYIHRSLHSMGYDSTQIIHRLEVSLDEKENRSSNPVSFYDSNTMLVYAQPAQVSKMPYHQRSTFLGRGYKNGGQLIASPFDFSGKNRITLPDLHSILLSVIFPESVSTKKRFNLTREDYSFLYKYLSMKPRESLFPNYPDKPDAYVKFILFGGEGKMEQNSLRIFNKPGDAYGFLTDVAYIVDFDKGVEFMLSATIHCNEDGIYNDNQYDYSTIGFPFLKSLGQLFYDHEAKRKKKHLPDLSAFQMN